MKVTVSQTSTTVVVVGGTVMYVEHKPFRSGTYRDTVSEVVEELLTDDRNQN